MEFTVDDKVVDVNEQLTEDIKQFLRELKEALGKEREKRYYLVEETMGVLDKIRNKQGKSYSWFCCVISRARHSRNQREFKKVRVPYEQACAAYTSLTEGDATLACELIKEYYKASISCHTDPIYENGFRILVDSGKTSCFAESARLEKLVEELSHLGL